MQKKYFGTDGIRGKVGEFPITPEFVLKLGYAIGKVFKASNKEIIVGKDTRLSGYLFEHAISAGLVAAGAKVLLTGPLPTPAISYLTKNNKNAVCGIVISASHNPYTDNGIKIFSHDGSKLSDEMELAIEKKINAEIKIKADKVSGKVERYDSAAQSYVTYCQSLLANLKQNKKLKIVLDTANGATYKIAPLIFARDNFELSCVAAKPDGININVNCGSTNPSMLAKSVKLANKAIGIAFDGDGDRLIMVDEKGETVDGDEILYIISKYFLAIGKKVDGVVGTLMTNLGLEQVLLQQGVEFLRTKVGDRYVLSELQKRAWNLGGETSGHIICTDYAPTGDGIIAAILVLLAMDNFALSLHDLKQGMHKLPQCMVNVPLCSDDNPNTVIAKLKDSVAAAKAKLGKNGRILLRPSGTEPLLRVMVEGENKSLVEKLANNIANDLKLLKT